MKRVASGTKPPAAAIIPTIAKRGRGRPRGAVRGHLAKALAAAKPIETTDRLTSYALHDSVLGSMAIFRPGQMEESLTPSQFLDAGANSADLSGYIVRLPRLIDKRHEAPLEMAVVVPTRVGYLEEDLLLCLLSVAAAGTVEGSTLSKLLMADGELIVPSTPAYRREQIRFQPTPPLVNEYTSGAPDLSVVTGPFFRIRLPSTTVLRQWRGRDNVRVLEAMLRCLERLSMISYYVRRADGNAGSQWGGLGLLRFAYDPTAEDGRDLTVSFPERLVVAMLGFERDGRRHRNRFTRIELSERFALCLDTARLLHRQLSIAVWKPEEQAPDRARRRGPKPANERIPVFETFFLDQLIEMLWGHPVANLPAEVLRGYRKTLRDALVELAGLQDWTIDENEATGRITVRRVITRGAALHAVDA